MIAYLINRILVESQANPDPESPTPEANTDVLVYLILWALDFRVPKKRETMMRQRASFTMNGETTSVEADLCIVDAGVPMYLTVAIEDKKIFEPVPLAQLVAVSIGVFRSNNSFRIKTGHLPIDVSLYSL